jgi:malate/lactate dehydrogenase
VTLGVELINNRDIPPNCPSRGLVGIVGIGAVGAAIAMAVVLRARVRELILILRARVRELILIDRNRARAKAVATDMHYGVPLSPMVSVADGEYSDLAGAGVTIIAAGVNEKSGGATDRNDPLGRLRLLDANAKVFEDIIPRIVDVAPQSVLLGRVPINRQPNADLAPPNVRYWGKADMARTYQYVRQ